MVIRMARMLVAAVAVNVLRALVAPRPLVAISLRAQFVRRRQQRLVLVRLAVINVMLPVCVIRLTRLTLLPLVIFGIVRLGPRPLVL